MAALEAAASSKPSSKAVVDKNESEMKGAVAIASRDDGASPSQGVVTALPRLPQHKSETISDSSSESSDPERRRAKRKEEKKERKRQKKERKRERREKDRIKTLQKELAEEREYESGYLNPMERMIVRAGEIAENVTIK